MLVFVLNAGSSSLKYQLMNPIIKKVFASGICERIAIDGVLKHEYGNGKKLVMNVPMPTHKEAISAVLATLTSGEEKVSNRTQNSSRWRRVYKFSFSYSPNNRDYEKVNTFSSVTQSSKYFRY